MRFASFTEAIPVRDEDLAPPRTKRGRKPLAGEKKDVLIGVRVPPTMANALFAIASRHRTEVSALTRNYWTRLIDAKSPLSGK